MGITHATAATGTDSGDGKISKNAWNEEHAGGVEEVLTGTGDLLYQGAFGTDYALSGTASSPWGSGPTNVNDGNDTTYWQGSENGSIYIKMDLGSARDIAGFRALTSNNNQTYYLQSSTDDGSYTTRYTRTLNNPYETGDITISGGPITARYWIMNPTGNGGGNFWRVHSFELLALGAPSRLPIGTDDYILRVATNVPAWEAETTIVNDPLWDAKGDIVAASAANTGARLAVGANGSSLIADSGQTTGLKWQLNKLDATVAPAVTDDSGDGYSVGSIWVDVTGDDAYICVDASVGAAVWKSITV